MYILFHFSHYIMRQLTHWTFWSSKKLSFLLFLILLSLSLSTCSSCLFVFSCLPSHLAALPLVFFFFFTSYSSSDLSSKKKHCVIYGKWTECMWSVDPQAYEAHKKSEKKGDNKKHKNVRAKTERCDVRSLSLKLSLCISLKHWV